MARTPISSLENTATKLNDADYLVLDQKSSSSFTTKKIGGKDLADSIRSPLENEIEELESKIDDGLSKCVKKAGDTMTGKLTLSGDPTEGNHAATKKYVDDKIQELIGQDDDADLFDRLFDMIYPIGSIYISITDELPSSLGGNGKRNWELLATGTTIWNVSDSSKLGDTIEAGLPDITGQFNGVCAPTISTGCFGVTSDTKGAEHGASNGGIMFKASRSNQIYGKSDTVQPPAVGVHMWKRMS